MRTESQLKAIRITLSRKMCRQDIKLMAGTCKMFPPIQMVQLIYLQSMKLLKKLRKLGPLSATISCGILTSCAMTTDSAAPTTSELRFCDGAKPFFWAKRDTLATIKQAKAHNAVGVDACGWGSKK